ncbi:MAG: dTDP-4-dehydrorhamnose reductase [Muribaculaceae bacterium]|nr:dTDP-4-dehydrorhamnose reductase [Muribaculaceae bacterium]
MKILVTGATGQLGNELRLILPGAFPDAQVLFTDVADLDLTDSAAVNRYVEDRDVTHIVNCAAYTAVDRAEEDKAACTAINVDAVKNLALAADSHGAKVIHLSTDYVFDGRAYRPYRESDKVNPCSHYGTTKRAGETALLALAPESIIIRTAWLYSPFGHNFVKTMLALGQTNPSLRVVYDQIGSPTYAPNLAKAIVCILRSAQWVPGIYHYADSGVTSWYDFTKAIHRLGGISGCEIRPIPSEDYPTAAVRPFFSVLDTTRIRLTYGVETPYWLDSLQDCINRLKKQ